MPPELVEALAASLEDLLVDPATFTTDIQWDSSVAADADGDFIVVWSSLQDGIGFGIVAQRYNSQGIVQGGEFRVNSETVNDQLYSAVAMDAVGNFVIAWESDGQDVDFNGIYAQRFDSTGARLGNEFRINSYTTGQQQKPAVAMNAVGEFVVSWSSEQDGSGVGIYAQRYDAAGIAIGSEFRVNSYTTNEQATSQIALNSMGNFIVSWQSYGQVAAIMGLKGEEPHMKVKITYAQYLTLGRYRAPRRIAPPLECSLGVRQSVPDTYLEAV